MNRGSNSPRAIGSRHRINERIRVREVRVIDRDGKMLGVLPTDEALRKAYDSELDLVEIVPNESPPVCKIMDYGKYLYELRKKEKETKKHQVGVHLKEVRFTSRIGESDYQVKLRHICDFLDEGDRVKVVLRFRGREITHKEGGEQIMDRIIEDTKDLGKVEFGPRLEGYSMMLQLVPLGRRK